MGSDGGKFDVADRLTADRLNRKTVIVDTGANIEALATTYPGQMAIPTSDGSTLKAGRVYRRNTANSAWDQVYPPLVGGDSMVFLDAVSTNIGDYATPLYAGNSPAENFDYASATGWTSDGSQVAISEGLLNFNTVQGGSIANRQGQRKALAAALANDVWQCDFEFRYMASASSPDIIVVGFAENTNWFGDGSSNDLIAAVFNAGGLHPQYQDGTGASNGTSISVSTSTTYYCRLERTSTTNIRLSVFSDSARTSHIAGSPVNFTVPATVQNLAYLVHSNRWGAGTSNTLTGTVDNVVVFSNDAANAIDGNTATAWTSASVIGPKTILTLSTAADKEAVGMALRTNAATTATQIKVEVSADGSTWYQVRLVNVSLLTHGAYNYFRWMRSGAAGKVKCVRITGTDGSAKVLSIDEVKVLTPTESQLLLRHGHKAIVVNDGTVALTE